jgi:integral membrane sensor domain MASE1
MSAAWMGMVVGMFVLASAAMLVIAHYRREHRRKRLLRRMDHRQCWEVMRRRH